MRWPFEKLPTSTKACICKGRNGSKKYPDASPHEIDEAMKGFGPALHPFENNRVKKGGRLLRTIARHLEEQKDQLVLIADSETSLGHDRLVFELKGQLRN